MAYEFPRIISAPLCDELDANIAKAERIAGIDPAFRDAWLAGEVEPDEDCDCGHIDCEVCGPWINEDWSRPDYDG